MRQFEVVFHVGISAIVSALIRKGGRVRISETKLLCIGSSLQKIGVLVEPDVVSQLIEFVLLADLLDDLLVLWSLGGLIDLRFPE